MLKLWASLIALGLVSGTASAAPPPKPQPNIEAVRAAMDPTNGPPLVEAVWGKGRYGDAPKDGPGGYWPERAQRFNVNGVAVVQCKLALSGQLSECRVLAEGPTTFYFGEACLQMVKDGRLNGKPPEGMIEGQPVRLVVVFKQ
jgi:TonB family protein